MERGQPGLLAIVLEEHGVNEYGNEESEKYEKQGGQPVPERPIVSRNDFLDRDGTDLC